MKTLTLTITALIMTISMAVAQSKTEEVKDRAGQKAEQRADQKIDNAIDSGLDKVENLFKFGKKKKKKKGEEKAEQPASTSTNETPSGDSDPMGMLNSMFGGGDVDVKEEYKFDHDLLMEVVTTKGNGKEKDRLEMSYYVSDDNDFIGYEMKNPEEKEKDFVKGIMNWEDGTIITIMEEQKQVMAIKMNTEQMEKSMEKEMDKNLGEGSYGFEKTGKTKEILGYKCEEYVYKNDDTETSAWISPEAQLDISRAMMGSSLQKKMKGKLPENYPQGAMLESTTTDLKNGEVTTMTTKEINMDSGKAISTKGYQIMSMGSFLNQEDK